MLQHLTIKNFALIHQVAIDFSQGMTVLTGETGAGKSIILDALSLALGGRADSHAIRPGAEQAEIAAIFDISQVPGAVLWLADLALANEDDLKQCIIRRIIHPQGRSRARARYLWDPESLSAQGSASTKPSSRVCIGCVQEPKHQGRESRF